MSSRREDGERAGPDVTEPATTSVQDLRGTAWPGTGSAKDSAPGQGAGVPSGTGMLPPPRQSGARQVPRAEPRAAGTRRRARLSIRRLDPWSVFVMSLLLNIFLGIVLLVAVGVLYALLDSLGVLGSVNDFAQELDLVGQGEQVLALSKVLAITAVIAAVDVVLLTVLATLGAFLYNVCASFTGGLEVTLSERE